MPRRRHLRPGRDADTPPSLREAIGVPPAVPAADPAGEQGATAAVYVAAVGMSMVVFVLAVNVVVNVYARGVVRGALDEGVRAGAHSAAAAAECQQVVDEFLDDLLGGPQGEGVTAVCGETPEAVTATADVTFPGWLPGVPDFTFELAARAAKYPAAGAAP